MLHAHEYKHGIDLLFPVFDSAFFEPPDFFGAHGPCTGSVSFGFRGEIVRTKCTTGEAKVLHAVPLASISYIGSGCSDLGVRCRFMGFILRMIAVGPCDMYNMGVESMTWWALT